MFSHLNLIQKFVILSTLCGNAIIVYCVYQAVDQNEFDTINAAVMAIAVTSQIYYNVKLFKAIFKK